MLSLQYNHNHKLTTVLYSGDIYKCVFQLPYMLVVILVKGMLDNSKGYTVIPFVPDTMIFAVKTFQSLGK